jgi:predicted esterase
VTRSMQITPDLTCAWTGPELSEGPLPALLYFALSAEESLSLDPFNQPVVALSDSPIRIFSLTLPGHEAGRDKTKAMEYWADKLLAGEPIIDQFAEQAKTLISHLIAQEIATENIGVAGLSRGAFAAAHVAAADHRVRTILGFAPLTTHFGELNLLFLADKLSDRTHRYYIGNRDTRVGTRDCFDYVEALVESAYTNKVRSSAIELILFPAIGHKGHGTPQQIFEEGARWIAKELAA